MKTTIKDFGEGYTAIEVENNHGLKLVFSDLGARIVQMLVPNSMGTKNIVLGFSDAKGYLTQDSYLGATIGRTAGRINKGQFDLEGQSFQVEVDPVTGHTLHGGIEGFELKKFDYEIKENPEDISVIFTTTSPDGENGYPGTMEITVIYTLTNTNEWRIQMTGTSDKTTLFNPTNHVYFNLTGDVTKSVSDHTLWLDSSTFAELASDSIPTGKKMKTKNSAFDFTKPTKLVETFNSTDSQKELFDGIDHPFFLEESRSNSVQATLVSPDGKISLDMLTNQPCVVVFTANFGETELILDGKKLANHGGITFETQVSPGAERFESFGSIVLHPGETFINHTTFKIEF